MNVVISNMSRDEARRDVKAILKKPLGTMVLIADHETSQHINIRKRTLRGQVTVANIVVKMIGGVYSAVLEPINEDGTCAIFEDIQMYLTRLLCRYAITLYPDFFDDNTELRVAVRLKEYVGGHRQAIKLTDLHLYTPPAPVVPAVPVDLGDHVYKSIEDACAKLGLREEGVVGLLMVESGEDTRFNRPMSYKALAVNVGGVVLPSVTALHQVTKITKVTAIKRLKDPENKYWNYVQ